MKLNRMQFRQLHEALLSAFLSRAALAKMVRFGLDERLSDIADEPSLRATVFTLIEWAEAHGKLAQLLSAAVDSNPGNPDLRAVALQLNAEPQGGAHIGETS